MSRAKTLTVEDRRYVGIQFLQCIQLTDAILQLVGVSMMRVVLDPPAKAVLTPSAGLPDDPHADQAGIALLIERHVFDDEPHDLLAVGWRCCRRVPYQRQVFAKGKNLSTVSIRD